MQNKYQRNIINAAQRLDKGLIKTKKLMNMFMFVLPKERVEQRQMNIMYRLFGGLKRFFFSTRVAFLHLQGVAIVVTVCLVEN